MHPAWAVAAFGAGLGVAAIALHLAGRAAVLPPPSAIRLTAAWSLAEMHRPTIVCRDLAGIEVPAGSRILSSGTVDAAILRQASVGRVAAVAADFALDAAGGRALLAVGGLRQGAWALPTSEAAVLDRLRAEVAALEREATPYAERRRVADLAGEPGLPVEAEGTVRDIVARAGGVDGHLLRLEDDGHVAAVRVASVADGLAGKRVLVRGRLARDASGYAVVEADEVRPLG